MSSTQHVTIYTPASPVTNPVKLLREMIYDVQAGKELAWRLFRRDLSAQFRQTYFGYLWAFVPPLVASATFIFLQSQGITRIEGTGIPYAAFAMIGTLLWQSFVEAIQMPIRAVQTGKPMLAKINFPREALLTAGVLMITFNFSIRLFLVAIVMVVCGIIPGIQIVAFFPAMLALLVLGMAVGLVLLPIGSLYGDIGRGIPIVAQFWMLLSPVVYPPQTQGIAGWLATFNPVSPLIVTAREALIGQAFTSLPSAAFVTVVGMAVLTIGLVAFRLVMPILIERMGG